MSVSAIILSFNARNDLDRCVRSLIEIEGLKAGRDQILVIDNGSTDGSRAVLENLIDRYPGLVDATFLPNNQGTTAPRNLGFAKAIGDHLLVIDSDIHFRTSILPDLIRNLDADPSIGIIAPELIFPDGRHQMSTDVFPTIPRKLERLFRLRTLERRRNPDRQAPRPVDYAISAFWLMRRDLIERIGMLDERIFYAPEDVDFCLRTWLRGRRVIYRPDLDVVHDAKERSRSLKGLLFTWRHIQGLAYFFRKHRYALSADRLYRRIGRPRSRITSPPVSAPRELESGSLMMNDICEMDTRPDKKDIARDVLPIHITIAGDWDADAWDAFALSSGIDGHFHAYGWRNVIWRALQHRPNYLIARRQGVVTGLLPMFDVKSRLFGRSLISVPFLNGGGVLADDDASAVALLRHAHELMQRGGYRYAELRHRRAFPLAGDLICRQHKVSMRLALPDDPDHLFEGFKAKLRSQIRRPVKAGAHAQMINGYNVVARDIDSFYQVFSENMRDLGTPVFPKALFQETVRVFGERAWLGIIWLDGHPAAAGLMVGFGEAIEMIWASSLRCFNRLSVNMLLYWEALRTAVDEEYKVFDFGRCTEDGPTYRFKAQWGAKPEPLHWYYLGDKAHIPDVSPTNPRFHLASRAWKTLPVPIANRLGPVIARSLP